MALSRGFITLLLAAAALVSGVVAATRLNVEMMPDLDFPVVTTVSVYPGASPEDVVEQVTKPVEQAVANVAGLKRLQSTSVESLSIVIAEFEFGTNTEDAESAIQSQLSKLSLPQSVKSPTTARVDLNDFPVVQVSLSGEVSPFELRRIAANELVPELSKVEGVYSVELLGGERQEVQVVLDPEKAAEKGITFQQVASLLEANSLELPAGTVEVEGLLIPVRTLHRFQAVEEVGEMVVGVDRGALADAQSQGLAGVGAGQEGALQPPTVSAAPRPSPNQGAPQAAVHSVQPGDTLSALAVRYGTTVAAIARASQISDPNLIYPGQKLLIPRAESQGAGQSPANSPPGGAPGGVPSESQSLPLVRLKDIASVSLDYAASGGVSRTNGKPSVLLMVTKTQDANSVRVAGAVTRRLEELKGSLGDGVETQVVADESRYVESSLRGLGREGLLGIAFAVLVIFAFLWSPRGTLIAAVSIPLSIALALISMEWQRLTLNVMTMAGLAVAVGRVVDDSIVVLENAHRHVQLGQTPAAAARDGTAEVAMPIAASTITTVAVFLPLGMVGGIIGQAFRPFALTVTFALLASLLVALTVVPVLCRLLLPPRPERENDDEHDLGIHELLEEGGPSPAAQPPTQTGNGHPQLVPEPRLLRAYTPLLQMALAHPLATVLLAVGLLAASLSLVPRIPTSFLPSDEEKVLMVQIAPPPGASRSAVSQKAAEVESVLSETPGVTLYQTSIGDEAGAMGSLRAALAGRGGGATLLVRLKDDVDLEAKAAEVRESLRQIQGDSRISVATQESMGTSRMQLVISGSDGAEVERAAADVERELMDLPGLANLSSDVARDASEIVIQVEPSRAAELGLTTAQLAGAIRGMVAGQTAGSLRQTDGNVDIRVSVPSESVDSPETLGKLLFGAPKPVPLSEIAQIREERRAAQITRVQQNRAADITGDIVAADAGAVSREIRERVAALSMPAGVSVDYGGVMQQLSEGFSSMGRGQLVGVALVFLTMALFFNSVVDPLVILVSLPLAAIGALPALYLTGRSLSMSGMIGMLMLIGIVVTNAIVLLDFARRPIREGRDPRRALLEAGRVRLRPILMTALTTILALAPLALGAESGSIIAGELAVVVMGGLLSSTLLTLLVVPAVYSLVSRRAT